MRGQISGNLKQQKRRKKYRYNECENSNINLLRISEYSKIF